MFFIVLCYADFRVSNQIYILFKDALSSSKYSVARSYLTLCFISYLYSQMFFTNPCIASHDWIIVNNELGMWGEMSWSSLSTVPGGCQENEGKISALRIYGRRSVYDNCRSHSVFASTR